MRAGKLGRWANVPFFYSRLLSPAASPNALLMPPMLHKGQPPNQRLPPPPPPPPAPAVTYLAPCPGPLPGKFLLAGSFKVYFD